MEELHSEQQNNEPLKIAVLGKESSGKTSLISFFIKNESNKSIKQEKDIEKYSAEINIDGINYKLNILDSIWKDNLHI